MTRLTTGQGVIAAIAAGLAGGYAELPTGRFDSVWPSVGPRRKKPSRPKKHRRLAYGPGTLTAYDQDMSDHLLLKALDQPTTKPSRFVEPVEMKR